MILSYPPQRDKLFLYGSGSGGVAECEGKLGEVGEEVAYVLVRAGEGGGEAFVTYVGEGVGSVLSQACRGTRGAAADSPDVFGTLFTEE